MKPVLVLNADYRPKELPFYLTSAEQAINRILKKGYHVVHFYDECIQSQSQERLLSTLGFTNWPSIVAMNEFVPRGENTSLNMENLMRRDKGRCRYCGDRLYSRTGTRDHYVPQSKGGQDVWTNVVLACNVCNSRKGDSMPEGEWRLEKPPHEPTYKELLVNSTLFPITIYDEEWLNYLPKWRGPVRLSG